MPFIQGRSLDRLKSLPARNEKEKWRRLATIGRDCADALSYAHASGVVHRDIKPANLILGDDDNIWITDFGLAKLNDDDKLSRAGDIIGMPYYMAPEQIRGECDERSDIYSLGLTLYELAVGERAWDEDDDRYAPLPAPRSRDKSIPKPLSDIISRACAVCPNERYQTAEEMKVVLNRYLVREKVADRRVKPRKELWSPSKRVSRKLSWVLALSAMVLGIYVMSFRSESGIRIPAITLQVAGSESEAVLEHEAQLEPVVAPAEVVPQVVVNPADQITQLADEQTVASEFQSGLPVLARRVLGSSDDAEEAADGDMKLTSTDLEMVWRQSGPQLIGVRFAAIDIPQGAFIQKAYIQFVGDECDIGEIALTIQVMDSINPPTFVKEPFNISSRVLKPEIVEWSPPQWARNDCTEAQRTPDLTEMVQQQINHEAWQEGNAIGFVISGEGLRCASTYDRSPPLAPMLCIEYTTFDLLKLEGIHWPQMLSDMIPAG